MFVRRCQSIFFFFFASRCQSIFFLLRYDADVPTVTPLYVACFALSCFFFWPAVLVAQEIRSALMYHMSDSTRESAKVDWLKSTATDTLMKLLVTLRAVKEMGSLFPSNTVDPVIVPFLPPYFRYFKPPDGGTASLLQISGNANSCGVKSAVAASLNTFGDEGMGGGGAVDPPLRIGLPLFAALTDTLALALKAFGAEKVRKPLQSGARPALNTCTAEAFYNVVRVVLDAYLAGTDDVQEVWQRLVDHASSEGGTFEVEGIADFFGVTAGDDIGMAKLNAALRALKCVFPDTIKLEYAVHANPKGARKKAKTDTAQLTKVTVLIDITDENKKLATDLVGSAQARSQDSLSKPEAARIFLEPSFADIVLERALLDSKEPATTLSMFAVVQIPHGNVVALRVYERALSNSDAHHTGQPISSVVGKDAKAVPVNETLVLYRGAVLPSVSISTFLSCFHHPFGNASKPIASAHAEMCCGLPHYSVLALPQQEPKALPVVGSGTFAAVFNQMRHAAAVADTSRVLTDADDSTVPAATAAPSTGSFGLASILERANGGGGAAAGTVTPLSELQSVYGPRTFGSFAMMVSAFVIMAAAALKAYLGGADNSGMTALHLHVCSLCSDELVPGGVPFRGTVSDCRVHALKTLLEGGTSLLSALSYKGTNAKQVKVRSELHSALRAAFVEFLGPTTSATEDAKDAVDTSIFFLIVCDNLSNVAVLDCYSQLIQGNTSLAASAALMGADTSALGHATASMQVANVACDLGEQMNGRVSGFLALVAGDNLSSDSTNIARQGFAAQLAAYYRKVSRHPKTPKKKGLLAIEGAASSGPRFCCTNCRKESDAGAATIHTNAATAYRTVKLKCYQCHQNGGGAEGNGGLEAGEFVTANYTHLPKCACGSPLKIAAAKKGTPDATVWQSGETEEEPVAFCNSCFESHVKPNLTDTRADQLETVTLGADGSAFTSTCGSVLGTCWLSSLIVGVAQPSTVTTSAAAAGAASGAGSGAGRDAGSGAGVTKVLQPVLARASKRNMAEYAGMDVSGERSSLSKKRKEAGKQCKQCIFTNYPVGCAFDPNDPNAYQRTVACLCCESIFCNACVATAHSERWDDGNHYRNFVAGLDLFNPEDFAYRVAAEVITDSFSLFLKFPTAKQAYPTLFIAVKKIAELEASEQQREIATLLEENLTCTLLCPGCAVEVVTWKCEPATKTANYQAALRLYNSLAKAAADDCGLKFTPANLNLHEGVVILTQVQFFNENNVKGPNQWVAFELQSSTVQYKNAMALFLEGLPVMEEKGDKAGRRGQPIHVACCEGDGDDSAAIDAYKERRAKAREKLVSQFDDQTAAVVTTLGTTLQGPAGGSSA